MQNKYKRNIIENIIKATFLNLINEREQLNEISLIRMFNTLILSVKNILKTSFIDSYIPFSCLKPHQQCKEWFPVLTVLKYYKKLIKASMKPIRSIIL